MNFRACFKFVLIAALALMSGCEKPSAMNESTANVKHITQGEFEAEVTRSARPVVVDFYATWCGPCRELSPRLDKLADLLTDKIKFVKVNVDESPGLAQNYTVSALPTLLLFKAGKVAGRVTGLSSEADLKAELESLAAVK
jgi:thioredoxin 1